MAIIPQVNSNIEEILDSQELKMADVTGAYIQLAKQVSEYTRVSTDELTKIIASIHQANNVI
jgi:hypothetical protein